MDAIALLPLRRKKNTNRFTHSALPCSALPWPELRHDVFVYLASSCNWAASQTRCCCYFKSSFSNQMLLLLQTCLLTERIALKNHFRVLFNFKSHPLQESHLNIVQLSRSIVQLQISSHIRILLHVYMYALLWLHVVHVCCIFNPVLVCHLLVYVV